MVGQRNSDASDHSPEASVVSVSGVSPGVRCRSDVGGCGFDPPPPAPRPAHRRQAAPRPDHRVVGDAGRTGAKDRKPARIAAARAATAARCALVAGRGGVAEIAAARPVATGCPPMVAMLRICGLADCSRADRTSGRRSATAGMIGQGCHHHPGSDVQGVALNLDPVRHNGA